MTFTTYFESQVIETVTYLMTKIEAFNSSAVSLGEKTLSWAGAPSGTSPTLYIDIASSIVWDITSGTTIGLVKYKKTDGTILWEGNSSGYSYTADGTYTITSSPNTISYA